MSRSGARGTGPGRGPGRSKRMDFGTEDQASSRRPFTDNSQLKLCNYAPKCSKKDSCHRAHNKKELESWQSTLCDTTREYSEIFTLKMCMHAAEICAKGLSCRYAHSQKELDSWNEHLSCRSSSGKLLEMCKRDKDCTYGDRCRYAHNSKELRSWKSEHKTNYLKSSKSKPEMCTYTVTPPTCKLGVACPFAHSKKEKEELVNMLADYDRTNPRPVPRKGKLLPYTLCKNDTIERKNIDGKCIYGVHCPQAHSEEELKCWEEQRNESVEEFDGTRLQAIGSSTTSGPILFGHVEEPTKEASPEDDNSSPFQDPFLVSLEDYQRHFGNQLSCALNLFITAAQSDIATELGGFIRHDRTKIDISTSEGQESASMFDLQYQLGFMQRNAKSLSAYVGMEESDFADVTLDLLEVRNSLAHGLHHRDTYEEKCGITIKYFRRAITFVGKVKDKIRSENLGSCFFKLSKVEDSMSEFLQYHAQMKTKMEEFTEMNQQQRTEKATETLSQLMQLVEEEGKSSGEHTSHVTTFVATCLNARFTCLPQQLVDTSKLRLS